MAGPSEPNDQSKRVPGREPRPVLKRFYKDVTVSTDAESHRVLLDGRPVRTPAKALLAVKSEALAGAVAEEWRSQGSEILPATMPLTTLICTAIDAVTGQQADVAAEIGKYAMSDLLCYRAETPRELIERQEASWDAVLAWAAKELATPFRCTSGLMHVEQSPHVGTRMIAAVCDLDPLRLAAVHVLTTLTGSAVLALAVLRERLGIDEAWDAAHVDEAWQIEKWGADTEAERRHAARLKTAQAAARVLASSQS